eukprot:349715_1
MGTCMSQQQVPEDDITKKLRVLLYSSVDSEEEEDNRAYAVVELYQSLNLLIEHPDDVTYQIVKANYMTKQWEEYESSVAAELLRSAGFALSNDGEWLIFSTDNISECQRIHDELEHWLLTSTSYNYQFAVGPDEWFDINGKKLKFTYKRYGMILKKMFPESDTTELTDYECHGNIEQCKYLRFMQKVFKQFEKQDLIENCETMNLCLDSFNHLMIDHEDKFEYIYNACGGKCDIAKCNRFRKHMSRRFQEDTPSNPRHFEEVSEAVNQSIVSKIHFYFFHSYDLFRLNSKESNQIQLCEKESKYDESMGLQINEIQRILMHKRKILGNRGNNINMNVKPTIETQWHCHPYISGHSFSYETKTHYHTDNTYNFTSYANIEPKFRNIKIEMTKNTIASLTMKQFNHEFQKAIKHYESKYCKQYKAKRLEEYNERKKKGTILGVVSFNKKGVHIQSYPEKIHYTSMNVWHVLAVMIYCNFDELQREFTKTYLRQ